MHGAFSAVNKEFGDMMSTLLPESTAKLVPVSDEQHLDDGLNVSYTVHNILILGTSLLCLLDSCTTWWGLERVFNRIKWRSAVACSVSSCPLSLHVSARSVLRPG